MVSVKPRCRSPVDYSKCDQTVTVYHQEGDSYSRRVIRNAFLDFRKNRNVDKTGSHEANAFLLIVPGDTQTIFPGDKVLLGVGAKVTDRAAWSALIPAKVPGLVVVKYTDPKYWEGQMVHLEAGG